MDYDTYDTPQTPREREQERYQRIAPPMSLNEYQDEAIEVSTHDLNTGRTCLEYGALALCGEAGELANNVKKHWRAQHVTGTPVTREQHDQIVLELGDVLWYAAFIATTLGIDLSVVARRNIEKLRARGREG